MVNVHPFNDAETVRQQRNLTNSQKKNNRSTKEGVLVNSFVKDKDNNIHTSLSETKDAFVISEDTKMPEKLYENTRLPDRKLFPLSIAAIGVMGAVAGLTAFVSRSAKISTELAKEKWLPAVTRNVQLSRETTQVIYQMVQNPNRKTFIAGAGVFALTAMAFMGKTFFDGYKEIWVKRREAEIQKDLQENLVNVETQSFSGKMQIIRSMLSKYTQDFEKYLTNENKKNITNFASQKNSSLWFGHKDKNFIQNNSNSSGANILLGLATILSVAGLGYISLKNLSKSKKHLENYIDDTKEIISRLVKKSGNETKNVDKSNLEHLFLAVDADETFVRTQINNLNWPQKEKEEFIDYIVTKIKTSTTKVNPNIGGDGTPKPAFNSFVEDYRAFFYNWLLDTSNPQFKQLFIGVTGITAVGYGGKLTGDALKEVQVKKINAETELELQKNLVSTELRNFKSKKDAAIKPLVDEFYKQLQNGKDKEELKTMAENILNEIKNGPPFVYS